MCIAIAKEEITARKRRSEFRTNTDDPTPRNAMMEDDLLQRMLDAQGEDGETLSEQALVVSEDCTLPRS